MDKETPPAKPRVAFGRGTASSASTPASRKHVPMPIEDALARMAGKMGERRRASMALRGGGDDEDDGVTA